MQTSKVRQYKLAVRNEMSECSQSGIVANKKII